MEVAQLAALAATHAKLREDNANQRKIVAEYEHYCVLLENTLANVTGVPVSVVRSNYRGARPLLQFNGPSERRSSGSTLPTNAVSDAQQFV